MTNKAKSHWHMVKLTAIGAQAAMEQSPSDRGSAPLEDATLPPIVTETPAVQSDGLKKAQLIPLGALGVSIGAAALISPLIPIAAMALGGVAVTALYVRARTHTA